MKFNFASSMISAKFFSSSTRRRKKIVCQTEIGKKELSVDCSRWWKQCHRWGYKTNKFSGCDVEMGAREEGKMIVCYVSRVDPMRVIILDLEFSLLIIFRVRKKTEQTETNTRKIFFWINFYFPHMLFSEGMVRSKRGELHWPFAMHHGSTTFSLLN
jgi:hypothetical protein